MNEKEQIILKKYLKYRRKKNILIIVTLLLLFIIGTGFCFYNYIFKPYDLINKSIIVEFGDNYVPKISDFISSDAKFTEDDTYFSTNYENCVGDYEISITHIFNISINKIKLFEIPIKQKGSIIVKDTTPPEFEKSCPTEIKIQLNEKKDISKYYFVSDLSGDCKITVIDDDVDYSTEGKYIAKIVASDKYNNTKSITVQVIIYDNNIVKNDITNQNKHNETTTEKETEKVSTEHTTEFTSTNRKSTTQKKETTKQTTKKTKKNYNNKDFLFTDGYTMDNVADAAYAYLKESGKSGSCIPLKNDEGIYIGMRVVFN